MSNEYIIRIGYSYLDMHVTFCNMRLTLLPYRMFSAQRMSCTFVIFLLKTLSLLVNFYLIEARIQSFAVVIELSACFLEIF